MKTVAVIDDDVYIGDMLEELLVQEGYAVVRAYSGTEALHLLERTAPDLILLDLMLPGLPGEDVLPHLASIPVIVLSAKADVQGKVDLLLGGACDYLVKPFDTKELLARIAVQLRKPKGQPNGRVLRSGAFTLDTAERILSVKGEAVKLTRTEYAILKLLMENQRQVVTKSLLLERIGRDTPDCTERSLKQHVSNLRGKLRKSGEADRIEAVWGIGFRLTEPREDLD